jgi:hypothetical protein
LQGPGGMFAGEKDFVVKKNVFFLYEAAEKPAFSTCVGKHGFM